MDGAHKMNLKSNIKIFFIWVVFILMSIHLNIGMAYSAEFEIEEIITAIKQDIQTARMTGSGTPNFEIETVTTVLTVTSTVTQKGSLLIKVAGYDREEQTQATDHGGYHKLSFNLTPRGTPGFSTESSFGLVEPINRIKFSLRKAYNNPPYAKLDTFTITLQFAIERESGGGFSFNIIDLNDLKAQNIAIHLVTIYMKIIN